MASASFGPPIMPPPQMTEIQATSALQRTHPSNQSNNNARAKVHCQLGGAAAEEFAARDVIPARGAADCAT